MKYKNRISAVLICLIILVSLVACSPMSVKIIGTLTGIKQSDGLREFAVITVKSETITTLTSEGQGVVESYIADISVDVLYSEIEDMKISDQVELLCIYQTITLRTLPLSQCFISPQDN